MVLLQKIISRADLRNNPSVCYVFGDNEERWGLGGQAREMRGEPNAIGVATLKAPGHFWSDENLAENCAIIDADLTPLAFAIDRGEIIVFPADGIGTGLARLPTMAPKTFAHLTERLRELGIPPFQSRRHLVPPGWSRCPRC